MISKCLSEEEEVKVERLTVLLGFLGQTEAINFVQTGPFRFDSVTGAFSDKLTGRIVAPQSIMIDLFYKRLCRDAQSKLEVRVVRSRMKGLRRLLVHFYKLDFLPLAY